VLGVIPLKVDRPLLVKPLRRIEKDMSGDAREQFAKWIADGDIGKFAGDLLSSCDLMIVANPGTKSVAICHPILVSRSTCNAHEPESIFVVPIKSDSEHYPPEAKLRVYRSRTGGNEWEPLTIRPLLRLQRRSVTGTA